MDIQINKNTVVVSRTNDKEKFYNESTFLYHIKNQLIKNGYDVIKKRLQFMMVIGLLDCYIKVTTNQDKSL